MTFRGLIKLLHQALQLRTGWLCRSSFTARMPLLTATIVHSN